MTDARLAAQIERAVVDAVHGASGADDSTAIARDFTRILADKGGADAPLAIAESILNGLRSATGRLDRVRIAVTGTGWVGEGVGSVEDAMLGILREAKRHILMTAYAITPGSSRILDEMERAVATGVQTRLVVERFSDQESTIRDRLQALAGRFPTTLALYDFTGGMHRSHLHAKLLVADSRAAVVGSANLTFHGMMLAHEMAVVVHGPVANLIARRIDLLLQSSLVRAIEA
jgi:cardiolipin synthase